MADSSNDVSGLFSTGFLWLAAFAIGWASWHFGENPIQGSRPASTIQRDTNDVPQLEDIDARLWQDPFAAVESALGKNAEPTNAGVDRTDCFATMLPKYNHLCSPLKEKGEDNIVLAIMLPGSPFSESSESRRQIRYAILSALKTEGYIPESEDHIGYFSPNEEGNAAPLLPKRVPFEQFDYEKKKGESLLLLWLDEDAILEAGKPLQSISKLSCIIYRDWQQTSSYHFSVLGPWASTTLKTIVSEQSDTSERAFVWTSSDGKDTSACKQSPTSQPIVRFYNYSATAVSAQPPANGPFVRTIATDEQVSLALIEELKNRQIDPVRRPRHPSCGSFYLYFGSSTFRGTGASGCPRIF